MRILIVGAGIGGLAAALTLHRDGHEVSVFEAAQEMRPLGVGINILPHAMKALDEVGMLEPLEAIALATRELAYFNKHGQPIWAEPRGIAAGYAWPQLSIHRGRLQMQLFHEAMRRLGPNAITLGARLESIEDADAGRVRIVDRDGAARAYEADLVIAADGIHSIARRAFYPDEGLPRFSGRMLWRATTVAGPYLTGASMIMAGHQDQKFVAYPIAPPDADGRVLINWIAELAWPHMIERENWNRVGRLEDFLPRFESWRFDWLDVPALIRGAEAVYEFPMVDRDPLPNWRHGRITLLGDAAHPMYPIGSNGASQAILDGQTLATVLRGTDDPIAALDRYEAARRPATGAIVKANRGNGPEICMQIAEERAPHGFDAIESVIPRVELEEIAARYKRLAGFDPKQLGART